MSQIHDEAQTRHVVAGVTTYAAAAVLMVTATLTILQGFRRSSTTSLWW